MTEQEHNAHTQAVLVTGGTGFAGRHLLRALLDLGYTNLHTTHYGKNGRALPEVCSDPHVHVHQLDLTNAAAVSDFIAQAQPVQIYHLASIAAVGKSFEQAESLMNNNIILQLHLLNAVKEHAAQARVLIVGSAEEYGRVPQEYQDKKIDESCPFNPVNPYAVTKVTQDLLAQAFFFSYKLNIVRARPFNHIGEGQTDEFVVPTFASQIAAIEQGKQDVIKVGNLSSVRDFTDVKDMVRAYITIMEKGATGEVYNIGRGQGWKIREILDMLLGLSTKNVPVEVDTTRLRPSDVAYFVADNTKVSSLGWSPELPIEHTLERILNEWRTNV